MRKLISFTFIFFLLSFILCKAEVRYVSHAGSNTPPYLTWETAADSIMSAINISFFGDTIYVANGVYEEQVVMIPGLSLIGAGMDSCVIDTRAFATNTSFRSVLVNSDCLLKGFQIIIANNTEIGGGIGGSGHNSLITQNRITKGKYGIYCGYDPYIYNNLVDHISTGIKTFNSNSIVRKNTVYTDPNSISAVVDGIDIEAFDYTYKPIIDSNLIYTGHAYGIYKSYGAKPVISNNTIILGGGAGMFLSYSDTVLIYNNLMFGEGWGIDNVAVEHMRAFNNYIGGVIGKGIIAGPGDTLENNVIANADIGIEKWYQQPGPTAKYNNLWDDSIKYSGFTPTDTTSLSVYPMVVNDDSTEGELDFHLQMFSPLIDKGDPNILDKDGSRSDIGLYGGPFGEIYTYQDLPPKAPVNLSATFLLDTTRLLLKWNGNKEADFSHYNLYRDTTENFTADSTTFVASIEDTFYLSIIPEGIDNLYFKLTAVDSQGNESEPSEELHVFLTGTINNEKFIINNYRLYQNYPNPFNPSTKIGYRLKERGYVKMYVYDIKGELVETLVNQYQDRGYYEVKFGASGIQDPVSGIRHQASSIQNMASGVYVYQIMVKNENGTPVFSDMKKMILLK